MAVGGVGGVGGVGRKKLRLRGKSYILACYVAKRSAAHLRKVFISNHWTWQASHDARRTRVSSSFAMP